jgi:hypothetical protein
MRQAHLTPVAMRRGSHIAVPRSDPIPPELAGLSWRMSQAACSPGREGGSAGMT